MKKLFIMLLIMMNSCAQSQKSGDDDSHKIVETFFVTYEKGGADNALNELFSTNDYFFACK